MLYGLTWCIPPTWTGDTEALKCSLKQLHGPVLEAALFPCYLEHGVIFYSFGNWRYFWPLFFPFDGSLAFVGLARECAASRDWTGLYIMIEAHLSRVEPMMEL